MSGIFVTPLGFQKKTLEEIKIELEQGFQVVFGNGIDLDSSGPFGQMIGLLSLEFANIWDLAQEIYTARNPNEANGYSLDYIAAETGVSRIEGSPTRVDNVFLAGDEGTSITSGSIVRQAGVDIPDYLLETTVFLTGISQPVAGIKLEITSVVVGNSYNLNINGNLQSYVAQAGDSAGAIWNALFTLFIASPEIGFIRTIEGAGGEIAVLGTTLAESLALFTASSTSASIFEVSQFGSFISDVDGAFTVAPETLTEIITPLSGWNSVSNPESGLLGNDAETDEELRKRRVASAKTGNATEDNIRSAILDVPDVSDVSVESNRTNVDETGTGGLPPKSFAAVVSGSASSQNIGDAIWRTQPAGIESYGNTLVNVVDAAGNPQVVYYFTPEVKFLWVNVTLDLYTEEDFPQDGEAQIKQAIVDFGADEYTLNRDIIRQRLSIPVYTVPGIGEIAIEVAITDNPGDTPTFVSTDIPIDARDFASVELSRITVVVNP